MILFFTQAQLEGRISVKRLKRVLDDDDDGEADTNAVLGLRRDASSKVASYLEPLGVMATYATYVNSSTGELLDANAMPFHAEVVRLGLDVAVALAAQRFPEVYRMDWRALMEQAELELQNLREGVTSLGGGGAPEVVNQGATVLSGNTTTQEAETQRFFDDMGDY